MTYGELKEAIEEAGIDDDTVIGDLDYEKFEGEPMVGTDSRGYLRIYN